MNKWNGTHDKTTHATLYKAPHIFKVSYNLMSTDLCIYHETITTIKLVNVSLSSLNFLLPLCFLFCFIVLNTQYEIYPLNTSLSAQYRLSNIDTCCTADVYLYISLELTHFT